MNCVRVMSGKDMVLLLKSPHGMPQFRSRRSALGTLYVAAKSSHETAPGLEAVSLPLLMF